MTHQHAERLRDHWYWRPGWRIGRRFYTWHITFSDHSDVVALADAYHHVLGTAEEADPIPTRWLHLTMQGIGFTDEVDQTDVEDILTAARQRCAAIKPFMLTIGPPYVHAEAVQIAVQPPKPVAQLRLALRAAIADVWGEDNVPEADVPFLPHMSLAYINRDGPAAPLASAIDRVVAPPATATINQCQLIVINRDRQMYEWDTYTTLPLGARSD